MKKRTALPLTSASTPTPFTLLLVQLLDYLLLLSLYLSSLSSSFTTHAASYQNTSFFFINDFIPFDLVGFRQAVYRQYTNAPFAALDHAAAVVLGFY